MRTWIMSITTIAVLIGVVGGAYWYGGRSAVESTLVLNTAPAASDGIKVHGDWTVTVSNPDGSVDSVHEFKNSLHPVGTSLVTSILAGESGGPGSFQDKGMGVRDWAIKFWIDDDQHFKCAEDIAFKATYGSWPPAQVAREPSTGNPLLISKSCTLVEFVETPGIYTGKLTKVYTQLRTDGTINSDPELNDQFTYWSPDDLELIKTSALGYKIFTEHYLDGDEQIDVEEGQYISFQVRIAFE
jgi:hypothetical protein